MMKSYQIVEFGKPLEMRSYEVPTPKGSEVLVEVSGCGVCHSDLHLHSGYYDLGGGKRITLADRGAVLPFTMGHEIAGRIVAVGPDAPAGVVGRAGVVFPWIGCGKCRACVNDREIMCETPRTLGTRKDGGYSNYVLVPDERYVVDYGSLDKDLAATSACSGLTAYSAIQKIPELEPSDTVVIIGAGGVGLAAVSLLKALKRSRVVAVDIAEDKRKAATDAGADAAVDGAAADAVARILAVAEGNPRAVIDFVGMNRTAELGMDLLGRSGQLIVVGLYGGEVPVSVSSLAMRNIVLQGSNVGTLAELRELVDILQKRDVVKLPVSSRPMSDVNDVMAKVANGSAIGRIVLIPAVS